jgi:hypothetical protein
MAEHFSGKLPDVTAMSIDDLAEIGDSALDEALILNGISKLWQNYSTECLDSE